VTSTSDPAIGNHNVLSLVYSLDTANAACYGLPYLGFGVSGTHGNAQPVALLDAAGSYRPHLKFNESAFSITSTTRAFAELTIGTRGWSDGLTRWFQVVLMPSPNSVLFSVPSPPSLKQWWNYNVKQSYYYPGGIFTNWYVADINSSCGFSWPIISNTNTYVGSGHSPSSISHYDIDLYATMHCIAAHGAWGLSAADLPDPIVISNVEWSLEAEENAADNPSVWLGIWTPTVQ
jgi:hypothetical protein